MPDIIKVPNECVVFIIFHYNDKYFMKFENSNNKHDIVCNRRTMARLMVQN